MGRLFESADEKAAREKRAQIIKALVRNLVYRAHEDELFLDDEYRQRYAQVYREAILKDKVHVLTENYDIRSHVDLMEALTPYPAVFAWMDAREALVRTAELLDLDAKLSLGNGDGAAASEGDHQ